MALADLACISPALVSMVENGQRQLRSADHVIALADGAQGFPALSRQRLGRHPCTRTEQPSDSAVSRPHATPSSWTAISSLPANTPSCWPVGTPVLLGTGYAAWLVNPRSTRGCSLTSSPRCGP